MSRMSPGVARAAQKLLLVVFVITLTYVASDVLHFHGKVGALVRAAAKSALYLSYLEAALLLVMLWLFGRYRISFGRNLLGLVAGFIASHVVNHRGEGIVLDVLLGVVGAIIGGWAFQAFGHIGVTGLNLRSILVTTLGSILFLFIYHTIRRHA